jgi:hypothetical protein
MSIFFDVRINVHFKNVSVCPLISQLWLLEPLSVLPVKFIYLMNKKLGHQLKHSFLLYRYVMLDMIMQSFKTFQNFRMVMDFFENCMLYLVIFDHTKHGYFPINVKMKIELT